MKSIFKAIYGNNKIRVENTWFGGEKLYVNEELQDINNAFFIGSSLLTGHIVSEKNEKLPIKARIYSDFIGIKCSLFIDDKEVKLHKVK